MVESPRNPRFRSRILQRSSKRKSVLKLKKTHVSYRIGFGNLALTGLFLHLFLDNWILHQSKC